MRIMFYGDEVIKIQCGKCVHKRHWGKYSCRTCRVMYSSNFKLAKEYTRKYQKKLQIKQSDERLKTLYSRVKEMYFNGNYLPHPNLVTFNWKRGKHSRGGWCRKSTREIRIGQIYKYAFVQKTISTNTMAVSDNFNEGKRKSLVDLMIHEAIHLRMAHHKRNFKKKTVEILVKVENEHIAPLYDGLLN